MFLRVVIWLIGFAVLTACVFLLSTLSTAGEYTLLLVGVCISAIPFFMGLYETLKLLNYIDTDTAFSNGAVRALKQIRGKALMIAGLYTVGLPYIISAAEHDDAPGVVAIGLVIIFASGVVAVFAAVLQKLLENAIEMKAENDLTV